MLRKKNAALSREKEVKDLEFARLDARHATLERLCRELQTQVMPRPLELLPRHVFFVRLWDTRGCTNITPGVPPLPPLFASPACPQNKRVIAESRTLVEAENQRHMELTDKFKTSLDGVSRSAPRSFRSASTTLAGRAPPEMITPRPPPSRPRPPSDHGQHGRARLGAGAAAGPAGGQRGGARRRREGGCEQPAR